MIFGVGWCEVPELSKLLRNFLNLPLGVFIGTVSTLFLVWALDSDLSDTIERISVSLFGAWVGLISAGLAVAGVLTNIANQNATAERNREQDLAAWRSVLPIALSDLIRISREGMHAAVRSEGYATLTNDELMQRIEADSKILETLRNCIKSTDSESARWLSVLAYRYQVYVSRSQRLMDSPNIPNFDVALDWATFHALVEHCFPFSRGAKSSIPRTMDSTRIQSAFWLSDIEPTDDRKFHTLVSGRIQRYGDSPVSQFEFHVGE